MLVVLASPSDFALEDEVVTVPLVEMDGNGDDATARGIWRWCGSGMEMVEMVWPAVDEMEWWMRLGIGEMLVVIQRVEGGPWRWSCRVGDMAPWRWRSGDGGAAVCP